MATPLARRDQIERAAAAARAQTVEMRGKKIAMVQRLIEVLSEDIRTHIAGMGGADGRISADQIPAIKAFLDGRLATYSARTRELIDEGIREAAKIGANLLGMVGREGGDAALIGQVVQSVRNFTAADGLQLSDRIWRQDRATKEALRTAIEGAIARGESSAQAAARFLRDGIPVPASVRDGIAAGSPTSINQSIAKLMRPGAPGSPEFNAQRLIRTEINRAYTESYVASIANHPDVAGVKFNLSPNHPETDICDLHAAVNLHGLGPGVYPIGEHPYPAHPQTLSFLTTVWKDQVTNADRAGKESHFEWLAKQPEASQDLILGGNKKGVAFRKGELKESELRMPWRLIAARLSEEGGE